jgi:hypothetical protein
VTELTALTLVQKMKPVAILRGRAFAEEEAAAWLWALKAGTASRGVNPITAEEFEEGISRAVLDSRWALTPADVWEAVRALRIERRGPIPPPPPALLGREGRP